jgi:hypothetical protein
MLWPERRVTNSLAPWPPRPADRGDSRAGLWVCRWRGPRSRIWGPFGHTPGSMRLPCAVLSLRGVSAPVPAYRAWGARASYCFNSSATAFGVLNQSERESAGLTGTAIWPGLWTTRVRICLCRRHGCSSILRSFNGYFEQYTRLNTNAHATPPRSKTRSLLSLIQHLAALIFP